MKRDPLMWAALAAALVVTASAEYELARACGFGQLVAGAVPAALDIYAVRALRAKKDVAATVIAMIVVNALSHLVGAGLIPVNVPLVVAVSAIAPLVLWRVHALRVTTEPVPELAEPDPVPAPVEAQPEPVVVDVEPSTPTLFFPVPELVASIGGTGRHQDEPESTVAPEPEPEPAEPEPSSGDVLELPPGVSAEHVITVKTWLAVDPDLTGTEIGTRLGKSDSYGRRVRRAALPATAA